MVMASSEEHWNRWQAAASGGAAGLVAAAVGGPLAVIVYLVVDPEVHDSGNIAAAIVGALAATLVAAVLAVVFAGIPAAALGAVLGSWINDKPFALHRITLVLFVGNLFTLYALVGWFFRRDGLSMAGVVGTLVVCTLASLVAIEVFKRLRNRIAGIT